MAIRRKGERGNGQKTSQSRSHDQYTVVLEGLRSDFRVFGEGMQGVEREVGGLGKKVDGLEQKVGRVEQKVDGLEQKVGRVEQKVDGLEKKIDITFEAVGKLQEDMTIVKTDVEFMKGALKKKVDYDEFIILQRRVSHLEAKMARRGA